MKYKSNIILISILSILFITCCKQTRNKKEILKADKIIADSVENREIISKPKELSINDWEIIYQDFQGIWGDFAYLDTLKKYNSIKQTRNIFCNKIVELQINERTITADKACSMEALFFEAYVENYSIEIKAKLLSLINKQTGEVNILKKIPFNKKLDAHLSLFQYTINKMNYIWFSGSYYMVDDDDEIIGELKFDEHGCVKGYNRTLYFFVYDDLGNDVILFSDVDEYHNREFFLIEYIADGYLLYLVDEDDIENKELKFKLKKKENNPIS